jgi:ethanolaminephosphotransferase
MMIVLFGPDMEGELPGWFCCCLGITFFLYMICDNVDGKQARRTASSSPLGMLFDHGIDCCTSVINNLIMQRLMQVGKSKTL